MEEQHESTVKQETEVVWRHQFCGDVFLDSIGKQQDRASEGCETTKLVQVDYKCKTVQVDDGAGKLPRVI